MLIELCDISVLDVGSMKRIIKNVDDKEMRFCIINLCTDIYVLDDLCTHADFSLSEGFLSAKTHELECPKHSAVFDIDSGKAKCLPATEPVQTYKVILKNNIIYIELE